MGASVLLSYVVVVVWTTLLGTCSSRSMQHALGCGGSRVPLCCEARDYKCQGLGPQMNNPYSATCFCDNKCEGYGDCCLDYTRVCKPVDCVLDKWGPYGQCQTRCGWGTKERVKRIIVEPRNGGKPCDPNTERQKCFRSNCKLPRSHSPGREVSKETGKIIPAKYGSWRNNGIYNPYHGIQKNLYEHYNPTTSQKPYCATYEIKGTRKMCNSSYIASWAARLQKGAQVCVECQPLAMKKNLGMRCHGHGVFGEKTHWNAVSVPGCHGEWVMKTHPKEGRNCCASSQHVSFILI